MSQETVRVPRRRTGGEVTWALYIDTDGKEKVDLYAFARLGRVISEHRFKIDADDALKVYREVKEREALRAAGQKEFDFA